MSVAEVARIIKKKIPELAPYPDQAVVDRYRVAYPPLSQQGLHAAARTFAGRGQGPGN